MTSIRETLDEWRDRPAMTGRATMAAGLVAMALLTPTVPQPGDTAFLGGVAAAILTTVGAVWASHQLDRAGSLDLTGRALAFAIAGGIALFAAPRAKVFGTDREAAFLLLTLAAGILACGLFAWLVHGIHRQLRGDERPIFLWVAAGSLLVSIPVQRASLVPIVMYSIPMACLAIEVVRSADEQPPAEAL